METGVLKVGSKVIVNKKIAKEPIDYISQIEDIQGERIKISTPMYKSALIRLHEGSDIALMVFSHDKIYKLNAIVEKNIKDRNLHFTDIIATSDIIKVERRNHYRLTIMKDILVRKKIGKLQLEYVKGTTLDISGGGMQFSSSKGFTEVDTLEIKIELDGEELLLEGKVLSVTRQEELKSYKYGIRFEDVSKTTEDKLIRYIFKTQREKLILEKK